MPLMAVGRLRGAGARAQVRRRSRDRRSVLLVATGLCAGLSSWLLVGGTPGAPQPCLASAVVAKSAAPVAPEAAAAPAEELLQRETAPPAGHDDDAVLPEPLPDAATMERLCADLADDQIRGNALAACARLHRIGAPAFPWLERTLQSGDEQQRHFAADVLRDAGAPASLRLCEVSAEALRHGEIAGYYTTFAVSARVVATRWLAAHAVAARPALQRAVHGGDDQQRFLAAFVLAKGGVREDVPFVARQLVEHLGDNQIEGDALMASHGLWCLGPQVLPELRLARRYADAQAVRLLERIERDLLDPARTDAECAARPRLSELTTVYLDPVLHFDVHRSVVPHW